jgi:uncharacterized membrane protein
VNTLTVWTFQDPRGAAEALPRLERLSADRYVKIDDAAIASWPEGARKPSARTLGALTGPGRLWGGSWGVLLGLIFLVPIAGPAFGAAAGAVAGGLSDFGLDDDYLMRVREAVTPGTSALFVLSGAADADRLGAELADGGIGVIRADLTRDQEIRLHAALGEESQEAVSS